MFFTLMNFQNNLSSVSVAIKENEKNWKCSVTFGYMVYDSETFIHFVKSAK